VFLFLSLMSGSVAYDHLPPLDIVICALSGPKQHIHIAKQRV